MTKQEKKLISNTKYQHKKKLKQIEDIRQQVKLELYDTIKKELTPQMLDITNQYFMKNFINIIKKQLRLELYEEIKAEIEKDIRLELHKKYIADAKMKLKKLRKHIESTNTDNNI